MGIRERARRRKSVWGSLELAALLVIFGCMAIKAGEDSGKAELNTKETQPSFKVQVQRNLVLARVVVRDSKGNAVSSLRQQDLTPVSAPAVRTLVLNIGNPPDTPIRSHVADIRIVTSGVFALFVSEIERHPWPDRRLIAQRFIVHPQVHERF